MTRVVQDVAEGSLSITYHEDGQWRPPPPCYMNGGNREQNEEPIHRDIPDGPPQRQLQEVSIGHLIEQHIRAKHMQFIKNCVSVIHDRLRFRQKPR